MNQANILKDKILSKKFEIRKSILIAFDSNSLHYQILVPRCRSSDKGNLHDTSRNTSCWVCPVDFDGRREMSSLSVSTVTYFDLFVGPFKRRDMSLMIRVPNFIL